MQAITEEQLQPITIAKKSRHSFRAGVTPGAGSNLVSFTVDGYELIHWEPERLIREGDMTGAFNMFPTTCRLPGGRFRFDGREITQTKRGETVLIHGLIRDEALEWDQTGDSVTSWIDISPGHPVYEGFPFQCRFTMTHSLLESGLELRIALQNSDEGRIPFSYGIHPFWKIHGKREDTMIRVPCARALVLENMVPTGASQPVEELGIDLRTLRSIGDLACDNAFWPRAAGDSAEMVIGPTGLRMKISASDLFAHMIVYSPAGEDYICVENLTSCPNATNLHEQGLGDVATLVIAEPGETVEGWIRYEFA